MVDPIQKKGTAGDDSSHVLKDQPPQKPPSPELASVVDKVKTELAQPHSDLRKALTKLIMLLLEKVELMLNDSAAINDLVEKTQNKMDHLIKHFYSSLTPAQQKAIQEIGQDFLQDALNFIQSELHQKYNAYNAVNNFLTTLLATPSKGTASPEDLNTILTNVNNWYSNLKNPSDNITHIYQRIKDFIKALKSAKYSSNNKAEILRSFLHFDQDNKNPLYSVMRLFSPTIYKDGITQDQLKDLLVNDLGYNSRVVPTTLPTYHPTTKDVYSDTVPKGSVPIELKGLKDSDYVYLELNASKSYVTIQNGKEVICKRDDAAHANTDYLSIKVSDLPKDQKGYPVIYMPIKEGDGGGYKGMRLYICRDGPAQFKGLQPVSTTPYFEVSTWSKAGDRITADYTAVDCFTKNSTFTIQLIDSNSPSGQLNFNALVPSGYYGSYQDLLAKMKTLYEKYDNTPDPDKQWIKSLTANPGEIPSCKNINQYSEIIDSLESAISNLEKSITESSDTTKTDNRIYFTSADRKDHNVYYVQYNASTKTFNIYRLNADKKTGTLISDASFKDTHASSIDKDSKIVNLLSTWIAGGDGKDKWTTSDGKTISSNITWGAIHTLTAMINMGMKASSSSPDNPICKPYFQNSKNLSNYYQTSFYNVYLRALQETGCNAYGSDFADFLGKDGTVTGFFKDSPWIQLNFYTSQPPTPSNIVEEATEIWNAFKDDIINPPISEMLYTHLNQIKESIDSFKSNLQDYATSTSPEDRKNILTYMQTALEEIQQILPKISDDILSVLQYIKDDIKAKFPKINSKDFPEIAKYIYSHYQTKIIPKIPTIPTIESEAKMAWDKLSKQILNDPALDDAITKMKQDLANYETLLTTYNKTKSKATWEQMQTLVNDMTTQSNLIIPRILAVMNKNKATLQNDLKINPLDFQAIASYIVSHQMKTDIPDIPSLPKPPDTTISEYISIIKNLISNETTLKAWTSLAFFLNNQSETTLPNKISDWIKLVHTYHNGRGNIPAKLRAVIQKLQNAINWRDISFIQREFHTSSIATAQAILPLLQKIARDYTKQTNLQKDLAGALNTESLNDLYQNALKEAQKPNETTDKFATWLNTITTANYPNLTQDDINKFKNLFQ